MILALVSCCSSSLAGGIMAKKRGASRRWYLHSKFVLSPLPSNLGPNISPASPSVASSASQSWRLGILQPTDGLNSRPSCATTATKVPVKTIGNWSNTRTTIMTLLLTTASTHLMPVVQTSSHNSVRAWIGSHTLAGYSVAPTKKNKGRITPTPLACSYGSCKRPIDDYIHCFTGVTGHYRQT